MARQLGANAHALDHVLDHAHIHVEDEVEVEMEDGEDLEIEGCPCGDPTT
jgi:hypothetical protein